MALFDLNSSQRAEVLEYTNEVLEKYYANSKARDVSPDLDIQKVRSYITDFAATGETDHKHIIDHVFGGLEKHAVQITHPSYFGLFNPRPSFPSIIADLLTATTNPQMAAWSHNPFSFAVEEFIISELGTRFGYSETDGTFCSGGAEANQTSVLCALNYHFPEYLMSGLRGLDKQPVLYCSAETHHSIAKAARMCGLGIESVRHVDVNEDLQMDVNDLNDKIEKDIEKGLQPFLVVATAGTTGPGSIDPLEEIGAVANQRNLWYHVDGAFGGALALHSTKKSILKGIELSDSITIDIHKWLSAPMGTGTFLTRHPSILSSTFRITADYMPQQSTDSNVEDPYTHSIQWSRRSLGLRMYLPLLFFGWEGFEQTIEHHMRMGQILTEKLKANGWEIMNSSKLPIVCFKAKEDREEAVRQICDYVVKSKNAWISVYPVNGILCLRACITNYATTEVEIEELISLLKEARQSLPK